MPGWSTLSRRPVLKIKQPSLNLFEERGELVWSVCSNGIISQPIDTLPGVPFFEPHDETFRVGIFLLPVPSTFYDPTGIGAMAPTMITYDTIEPSMRCTEKDEESM